MSFEYPPAPVVGVGAVIVRDGRALIIRRAHEPRKGEWSLPGGKVELGETMIEAVRREMKEETGLDVDVGPLVELFDRVHRDAEGRVRYHFVIADFLCAPIGGQEQAGDDADALAWAGADDLAAYRINRHAMDVILKGLALVERNNDL